MRRFECAAVGHRCSRSHARSARVIESWHKVSNRERLARLRWILGSAPPLGLLPSVCRVPARHLSPIRRFLVGKGRVKIRVIVRDVAFQIRRAQIETYAATNGGDAGRRPHRSGGVARSPSDGSSTRFPTVSPILLCLRLHFNAVEARLYHERPKAVGRHLLPS